MKTFKTSLASFFIFSLLLSALPVLAQGEVIVSLDSDSPSGIQEVSTTAELIKFTLKGRNEDMVVSQFRFIVDGDGLDVKKFYVFMEDNNALVGSVDGAVHDFRLNGIFLPKDEPITIVVKADMRGPADNVQVTVEEIHTDNEDVVEGVPLKGLSIAFIGEDGSVFVPDESSDEAAADEVSEDEEESDEQKEEEPVPMLFDETDEADEKASETDESKEGDARTDAVTDREKVLVEEVDEVLVKQVKGRILLQVEEAGEAWYVEPDREEKYYLRDGSAAYEALRRFGLGITNNDLRSIPIGTEDRFEEVDTDGDGLSDKLEEGLGTDPNKTDTDGDGFDDKTETLSGFDPNGAGKLPENSDLTNRLTGKILLQVESRGEAWYINPEDGRRYYLADGEAAYQIMRFLSLGITNEDLRKIAVGE